MENDSINEIIEEQFYNIGGGGGIIVEIYRGSRQDEEKSVQSFNSHLSYFGDIYVAPILTEFAFDC